MTFRPEQIVANEEWDRRHESHEVAKTVSRYPFEESSCVRRMFYWTCVECEESHLHKMDNIFECPHCHKEMEEDAPCCKKCSKNPTCCYCNKKKNRVISIPGTNKGACGPCYRRRFE